MGAYFPLAEQFVTQAHPAFCGVSSLTMALNALLLDPGRVWQGVWRWFDESMLDCCLPHDLIKLRGVTLAQFGCLARCNGAEVVVKYSADVTLDEFRDDVKRVCREKEGKEEEEEGDGKDGKVMVMAYSRGAVKQAGGGHFSPVGGYHAASDHVLVMDVARFKYPPHWLPLPLLHAAMQAVDDVAGMCRGYALLSRSHDHHDVSAQHMGICCPPSCQKKEEEGERGERGERVEREEKEEREPSAEDIVGKIDCLVAHECERCVRK